MHEGKHSLMHSKKIPVHCRFCTESKFKLSLQQTTEHQHCQNTGNQGLKQTKKLQKLKQCILVLISLPALVPEVMFALVFTDRGTCIMD